MERDPETAPLDDRRRALVDYALKLTKSPNAVSEEDITALKKAGFSDRSIHDAAAIVGYYAFVNRIAMGLGVELEEEYIRRE